MGYSVNMLIWLDKSWDNCANADFLLYCEDMKFTMMLRITSFSHTYTQHITKQRSTRYMLWPHNSSYNTPYTTDLFSVWCDMQSKTDATTIYITQ
jgi:hypothetical protein